MRIAMVTWEQGSQDNNIMPPLLVRLLPEHEFIFFSPQEEINCDIVNTCDVIYIDADLFGSEITTNNMHVLDNATKPVIVRFMGEWMKWHMYNDEWRNSYYKQFNHDNVNIILCEELHYKLIPYLFPSKTVKVYPWLSDLEDIRRFKKNIKLNKIYLMNGGEYLRYATLGIANYLPNNWTMIVCGVSNESLEVEIELGVFDDKLNVVKGIINDNVDKVEFIDYSDKWTQYLDTLSRCSITLSPDNRFTVGRACIESAALGIPAVNSTSHSGMRLFPDLTVPPYDVEGQHELILRLIEDKDFYEEQVQHGLDNVDYYGLTETNKQKWEDILCV